MKALAPGNIYVKFQSNPMKIQKAITNEFAYDISPYDKAIMKHHNV